MNKTNFRIHVAPIGYEIDRVILPAKERRADKMYLMVHNNKSEDKALQFIETIKKRLTEMKIEYEVEDHDRLDIFNIIKTIKEIIEKEQGNNVYVNLSSGSKIQAIGGMMACMMFNDGGNVIPFYAEAKEYVGFENKPISEGIKEIMDIPSYEIQKPDEKIVRALKIIQDHGGTISKKQMAALCGREDLIAADTQSKNVDLARYASLDKSIIQPLESHWKFIAVEKKGRTRWITINEDGANAAKFLI